MTSSTYTPSRCICELDQKILLGIITRYVLITELQEVPSPEVLEIITSMIIDEFPKMEIGELVICLKKGITGAYGPLYNKISIDTIPTWVRKYYEVTWKEIEANAIMRNKRMKAIEIDNPGVPCPPEISEKLRELEKKLKFNKPIPKENKLKWESILDFCTYYNYNYSEYCKELNSLIVAAKEEDTPSDIAIAVGHQRHLVFCNIYGPAINNVCDFLKLLN
jgi:hypothetical protein